MTVGLSLTIPLSLVGEMVLQGRTEGLVYWIGACIVVGSFVFVDREEVKDEVEVDNSGNSIVVGIDDDSVRETGFENSEGLSGNLGNLPR